jgi:hypothetical protein
MHRGNLLADDGIIWGFFDIDLRPMRVILGDIGVGEDSLNGTFGNTGVAIDAGIRIDIEAVGQFVKRLDGADCGAVSVLAIDTRFRDYIGHLRDAPFKSKQMFIQ